MTDENQDWHAALHHELELLRNSLELAQAKTQLLMRHDLAGLEASLVREAEMIEQLGEAQQRRERTRPRCGQEVSAEGASLAAEMSAVAREIQLANKTNVRLIQNGQRFCEVLYEIICPVQTYSPSMDVISREVESRLQVQY